MSDEQGFQKWYGFWSGMAGLDKNPDDPLQKYDYRAAYHAGVIPKISPIDGQYHWPSDYKYADHPNRFVDGIDTITGKREGELLTGNDLAKIRVRIPKIGTVMFPADLDPIQVDQEARKLYMKANAGRLPVQQPQPQMGPPAPLPERYMSRAPERKDDIGGMLRNWLSIGPIGLTAMMANYMLKNEKKKATQ
jgi:hypothetical protein